MQIQKLVFEKVARCPTKVPKHNTKVAPYSTKVGIENIPSKHTHAGSSFKDHVTRNPTVKTDLNSAPWFERNDFLKN